MIGKVNLFEELQKAQQEARQEEVLEEAVAILKAQEAIDGEAFARIKGSSNNPGTVRLTEFLDPKRIFTEQAIETLCTRYRLRFLESKMFKGQIPFEAVSELMQAEKSVGTTFSRFFIVAPAERFLLKDSQKDPLLFASLGNGKYYFIHQWGKDMSWYKAALRYPFRHFRALCVTSMAVSLLLACLLPVEFSSGKVEFFFRFFLFGALSCLFVTLAVIAGIICSEDFSENVWNSRYFN